MKAPCNSYEKPRPRLGAEITGTISTGLGSITIRDHSFHFAKGISASLIVRAYGHLLRETTPSPMHTQPHALVFLRSRLPFVVSNQGAKPPRCNADALGTVGLKFGMLLCVTSADLNPCWAACSPCQSTSRELARARTTASSCLTQTSNAPSSDRDTWTHVSSSRCRPVTVIWLARRSMPSSLLNTGSAARKAGRLPAEPSASAAALLAPLGRSCGRVSCACLRA
mmetsp:Transcript_50262/g.83280  ORF Transcript_50262/g.83280 Transcript_50262/m.83280 type:complete len:225 (+) Transcript_50262:153-827(+)